MMGNENNKSTQKENNSSLVVTIAKYSISLVGVIYFSGILISNIYLGNFGICDISIIRTNYLLRGTIFILYLFIPAMIFSTIVCLIYSVIKNTTKGTRELSKEYIKGKRIVAVSFWLFAAFYTTLLLTIPIILSLGFIVLFSKNFQLPENISLITILKSLANIYDFLAFILILVLYIGIAGLVASSNCDQAKFKCYFQQFAWLMVILSTFILLIFFYSTEIAPTLSQSTGGLSPPIVDLPLNNDGIAAAKKLNLNLNPDGVLEKVLVFHENSDDYYLGCFFGQTNPNNGGKAKVIRLPKIFTYGSIHRDYFPKPIYPKPKPENECTK